MRVVRQWRDMKRRKWHGFAHDTNRVPRNGDLVLFCPACPQEGINLPEHWQDDPEMYVIILSASYHNNNSKTDGSIADSK